MDLTTLSLAPLEKKTLAILGYGNQGRTHALNLRDSGLNVLVGARKGGEAFRRAVNDGFSPVELREAARSADVVMLLLPDQVIPDVHRGLVVELKEKFVGFAHGFALHFQLFQRAERANYFLVGPKGAGAILRDRFERGGGLPGVFAVASEASGETKKIATAYAKGIGCATSVLIETSFQEETECDLFGEQAVLCGGIPQLMEMAFETLVKNGHSPEMAFFECCFEAKTILDLWMKFGPKSMNDRISPTAAYGGATRGRRLIVEKTRVEMESIFQEVRSGKFANEWMGEVKKGTPNLSAEKDRIASSPLEAVFQQLKRALPSEP